MVRFLFVHFVSYFIESKIQRKCNESFFVAFALHCLFMIRKTCHYIRTGCGEILLVASPRASPYVRPPAVFFATCDRPPAACVYFFIACMRFRRGRPDFSGLSIAGYFPGRTVAAGGPLRAECCPKRRCQFESVAAQPHLSPRKGLKF